MHTHTESRHCAPCIHTGTPGADRRALQCWPPLQEQPGTYPGSRRNHRYISKAADTLIGSKRRGGGREGKKGSGGKRKTKPLTQWENTTIQCGQDETNPVQHCPVKFAALYYSQLALSSSVVSVLFLKDNFTFHPLSSETLLKVRACYYEQKSSVNAEMLYPLLLLPCHRWILKHSIIKKENICWECSIPFQQQAVHVEETPLVLHSECRGVAVSNLLCLYSSTFPALCFSKPSGSAVPATLVPSAKQEGMRACPSEGRDNATARTRENQVIFMHLKISKQTIKNCSKPKRFKATEVALPSLQPGRTDGAEGARMIHPAKPGLAELHMVSLPAFPKCREEPLLSSPFPSSLLQAHHQQRPQLFLPGCLVLCLCCLPETAKPLGAGTRCNLCLSRAM